MELDSARRVRTSTRQFVAFPQHPSETEAAAVLWNLRSTGTVTGVVDIGDAEGQDNEAKTAAPSASGAVDT
eukprot:2852023-Prorocentrum_lima.AAC.1